MLQLAHLVEASAEGGMSVLAVGAGRALLEKAMIPLGEEDPA